MKYPEDITTAAQYLKTAIPRVVAHQLPANPVHYSLWYNYVANHIPSLNKAMDSMISDSIGLTSERCHELFQHYIINEHLEEQQKNLERITQLAAQLLSHINESMAGSEKLDAEITSNIEELQQVKSMDEVSSIVDNVINASENIRNANTNFIENIKQANAEIGSLRDQLQEAEKSAYTDQLTQLYNRHAFDRQLAQLLQTDTVAKSVCLIIADLDHFKSFNDDYGHIIGDRVLQRMGEIIQDHCPDNAIGSRYGGEEFAIILSNSSIAQATEVAEILRKKLQQLKVKIKNSDKILDNISASFGIAQFQLGEGAENFIDRADQALYRSKENGRNQVSIY